MSDRSAPLPAGHRFDRFEIACLLGEGGMGRVYRARDTRLNRDVAVKILLDRDASDEAKARMLREARADAGLSHANAVALYDVAEDAELGPYIVMELVEGETLRQKIGDRRCTLDDKLRWLDEVASALDAAHAKNVVHRDMKPENVVVRADGAAKVLDFGIAKRFGADRIDPSAPTEVDSSTGGLSTLTADGSQIGTPLYMAPEQIRGEPLDGRADQFAWGVLAYELLSGRSPWRVDRGTLGATASTLSDEPAPLGGVAAHVQATVSRALAKDPAARFPSMGELRRALRGEAPAPAPARPATTESPRYDTETLREIFDHALRMSEAKKGYAKDDLVEAAREMGIDEATVLAAARDVEVKRRLPAVSELRAAKRKKRLRGLVEHLGAYVIVNVFMALLMGGPNRLLLIGWGMGLAFHVFGMLFPKGESDEELLEEAAKKALVKRAAQEDIEAGATALLGATARRASGEERARISPRASTAETPAAEAEREARAEDEAREGRSARRSNAP
jgi:hypothetical protein